MPKKFSDTEKEYIVKRLKEEAMSCLAIYGVRKTTVDELVKRVNIPKGTFYLFYESKELLLFDAIRELHDEFEAQLQKEMRCYSNGITIEGLTDLLFKAYKQVNNTGLMLIMTNGELEYLMRKLPEKAVKEHLVQDDINIEQLFSFLLQGDKSMGDREIETFSGALRAVFMTMMYKREIGEQIYDDVIRVMLKGIVMQIMEEKSSLENGE
ncbi:MAG TPA: TetR/AcrR family transcriptional regulator [Mobilitalea sp.]|nr:TetR/AcrR family transcriptional regulator [Mobilitalea sp.]